MHPFSYLLYSYYKQKHLLPQQLSLFSILKHTHRFQISYNTLSDHSLLPHKMHIFRTQRLNGAKHVITQVHSISTSISIHFVFLPFLTPFLFKGVSVRV